MKVRQLKPHEFDLKKDEPLEELPHPDHYDSSQQYHDAVNRMINNAAKNLGMLGWVEASQTRRIADTVIDYAKGKNMIPKNSYIKEVDADFESGQIMVNLCVPIDFINLTITVPKKDTE